MEKWISFHNDSDDSYANKISNISAIEIGTGTLTLYFHGSGGVNASSLDTVILTVDATYEETVLDALCRFLSGARQPYNILADDKNSVYFHTNVTAVSSIAINGNGRTNNIVNVTAATVTLTAAQSGSIVTLNRAGGITVTLPAAVAGLKYTFHVGTTFTGTMQIDAASSADTLQGRVNMGTGLTLNDVDDNVDNHGYAGPAAADHQYVADADTKGRHLGTRLKYECITDAIWLVSGNAISDGGIVTPFT